MKTLTTLLSLIITVFTIAQEMAIPTEIVVKEKMETLDKTSQNAFVVSVQGDDKEIKNALKDYFENKYAIPFKGLGNTFNSEAINNSRLSDQLFTLFVKISKTENAINVAVFMSFGDGKFVKSPEYTTEADRVKKLLSDFARDFYAQKVQEMMEEKTKEIEKLNKSLAKVIDDKADLAKDVSKIEKDLAKNQSKISKAQLKIEKYQEKIKEEEEEIAEYTEDNEKSKIEVEKANTELKEYDAKISTTNDSLSGKMEELNTLKLKLSKLLSF